MSLKGSWGKLNSLAILALLFLIESLFIFLIFFSLIYLE